VAFRGQTSCDQEECSRGKVCGHHNLGGSQGLAALDCGCRALLNDVDTERSQHSFGVISRWSGLSNARLAGRLQPGEKYCRFNLCAGDRSA